MTPIPSEHRSGAVFDLTQDGRGRLVGAGSFDGDKWFGVVRYLANGTVDTSFGGDGFADAHFPLPDQFADAVAVQSDGKVIAAGGAGIGFYLDIGDESALARFGEGGDLDPTFGGDGMVTSNGGAGIVVRDVALQSDGRIVAVGIAYDFDRRQFVGVATRYLSDGSLDRSFGRGGRVHFRPAKIRSAHLSTTVGAGLSGVAILPSGKIVVTGDNRGRAFVARLLPSGRRDRSFGRGDGQVLAEVDGRPGCDCFQGRWMAIQGDGRILVLGDANSGRPPLILARFTRTGRLDPTFGGRGRGIIRDRRGIANEVAVQRNGKILLVGLSSIEDPALTILRYLPTGRPDGRFGNHGRFVDRIGQSSNGQAVFVQNDGRVVVAGNSRTNGVSSVVLIRLLPD